MKQAKKMTPKRAKYVSLAKRTSPGKVDDATSAKNENTLENKGIADQAPTTIASQNEPLVDKLIEGVESVMAESVAVTQTPELVTTMTTKLVGDSDTNTMQNNEHLAMHPGRHGGRLLPPMRPGETRNPHGRPAAGTTIKENYNLMVRWPLGRVRSVFRDPDASAAKRMAAKQVLQAAEAPDLADLDDVTNGTMTLSQAKRKGLPTHEIKKIKVRKRTDSDGVETVEREIELHPDKSGEAIDRIADRTVGKPLQANLTASVTLDPAQRSAAAVELARQLLGLDEGVVRLT